MKLSRIKKLVFLHLQHLPMKPRGWRPTLCKWGGVIVAGSPAKIIGYTKDLNYNISSNQKDLDGIVPYLQPKE